MARLLLIDDEGIVRGALQAVLTQQGHTVSTAKSGPEGLDLLAKEIPDLILLDRNMPGMTGSQVLKEIRQKSKDVRVIILTGSAFDPGEEKYRALGISAFLSKDMGIETLLKVIEREVGKAAKAPEASGDAGAATILVTDDDASIRSVLQRFLVGKGYKVETATNGKEALAALERFTPQMILLDMDMPVMSGLEALKTIHQTKKEIPVIMITGNNDAETARKCMELGAWDYIVKPLNFEYLETSVWAKILMATP